MLLVTFDTPPYTQLQRELSEILSETESYRIDHYLGKELVMNVLVLRFANICFEVSSRRTVSRSLCAKPC